MAKKRKAEEAPAGAAPWMNTFADLMNLLLCFFVLLFAMSTVEEEKFEQVAQSLNSAFSIFDGGAEAIGDGILISNGVSQLNELDQYINSTGKLAEDVEDAEEIDEMQEMQEKVEEAQMEASEELAEKVAEAVSENKLSGEIDIEFTSQYVQLTLSGSVLFD